MALHSKADYTYQVDGKIVTIRDLNRGNISVTNDAEEVLKRIGEEIDLSDKRVQYYDSAGQLDRLLHSNGVFEGFAPGSWEDHRTLTLTRTQWDIIIGWLKNGNSTAEALAHEITAKLGR